MSKQLSEQQEIFLEALFGEAQGIPLKAKRIAGYSDSYPASRIVEALKDEIVERTKQYLAGNGPKAAIKLVGVLDDPSRLGNDQILKAAKEVLDRIGVNKDTMINIGDTNGIFILPSKVPESDS